MLHVSKCTLVAAEPIGDDDPRIAGVLAREGTLEEAPGWPLVSLGTQPEFSSLASAVDSAIEIAPVPINPNVGFIDMLVAMAGSQMRVRPLPPLRSEAQSPFGAGCAVDLHTAFGEHTPEIRATDGNGIAGVSTQPRGSHLPGGESRGTPQHWLWAMLLDPHSGGRPLLTQSPLDRCSRSWRRAPSRPRPS